MKTALLVAFLCTILGRAWSQSEEKNVIKINPLSALVGAGSMFYENKIDTKHSWQIGFSYMGPILRGIKCTGLAITPEYRIYLKNNALSGTYFGPYVRYKNYMIKTSENDKETYTSFGGGVVCGHQWVYKSGFVLDLFAGPCFNSSRIEINSGSPDIVMPGLGSGGFGLRVGIALGFGF